MATPSKPFGFFDLPREIRDEIYRHYFSGIYVVPLNPEISDTFALLQDPDTRGPDERHILNVNKVVRAEAEASLYRHASFQIYPQFQCLSGLSQVIIDKLLDVQFYMAIHTRPDSRIDHCDSALQKFSGNKIARKSCHIEFDGRGIARKSCHIEFDGRGLHYSLDNNLFDTLKRLVGFETVIIQLCCPQSSFELSSLAELSQGRRKPKWPLLAAHENKFLSLFEESRHILRVGLESTFGPGQIYDEGEARCVEFHPLRHLARQSR